MNKDLLKLIINPFERIAGGTTLGWGLVGLLLSAVLNYFSGWYYDGLLHFGPAPEHTFYKLIIDQLIVWLVPATLFYTGGVIFSKSHIRPIDVYGTVAFSLLALIPCNILYFTPILDTFKEVPQNSSALAIELSPEFINAALFGLLLMIFVVWMFIWMFQAVKVCCNLKGGRLWGVYLIGIIGGEILCRLLIGWLYA